MTKKIIIIAMLFVSGIVAGLTGCVQNNKSTTIASESNASIQEIVSAGDHTISMMTGDTFDFAELVPDIEDIKFIEYTTKDNIETSQERIKEEGVSNVILRSNGRITSLSLKGTTLTIIQSDGRDEAKIEVTDKEGKTEIYTVIYDCNCE